MKIVTWNINSVRLRIDMVVRFLAQYQPDILCLQETKTIDDTFPSQALKNAGYPYLAFHGMKSYNGVAIISKLPFAEIFHLDFTRKQDCRHIAVKLPNGIEIHNFYVPAGGDIPNRDTNPKFAHKLDFLDDMKIWFANYRTINQKIILLGDLNIAPLPQDVWSHKQLLNVVSHTPIEVDKLMNLQNNLSWIDSFRHFDPALDLAGNEVKLYSWWSYRSRDWQQSNRGRRLDHIWTSPALQNQLYRTEIYRHIRGWERPSDHVPMMLELR